MNVKYFLTAALLAGPFLMAPAAQADVISIGLQEAGVNGGAITTVASGATAPNTTCFLSGDCIWAGSYGTFAVSNISGLGNPPLTGPAVLDSSSMNLSSTAAGMLLVYVSETGIAAPASGGLPNFISTFTENMLSGPITVTQSTYLDAADGTYGLTTPLGSVTFPPLPLGQPVPKTAMAPVGPGPYSVTAVYQIVATGAGQDNSTIDVAIPEPPALGLFGTALLGLALFGPSRRRRCKANRQS